MTEPKIRFKRDDGCNFEDIKGVPFGDVIEQYSIRTKEENEDILLSCTIDGVFLNSELFSHQRGSSNKGYKKIDKNTLILSAQNLHLGNANVNQRFEHGIISPAYNTYHIVGCNPDYLAQWIKREATKHFFYNATTTGASVCRRNVEWDTLYGQIFYLPCEEEQQKIADFLNNVDEIIAASEEEVANLEQQKKAMMQKIFSQEVRFKKDDGSDYPAWENDTLDNLGTFMKGAGLSKADISDTGNPFILYGELYTTYNEVAYDIVRKTQAEVDEKYYSKIGDVLIPTSGESPEEISTATCVMQDGVILAGDLNIYRSDVVDGRVMSYIINHKAKDKIARIAQGKSVVHIQAKSVGKVDINYPPDIEEQKKIAEFFSDMDDAIASAKQELEKWKELKKGLLQQMFV